MKNLNLNQINYQIANYHMLLHYFTIKFNMLYLINYNNTYHIIIILCNLQDLLVFINNLMIHILYYIIHFTIIIFFNYHHATGHWINFFQYLLFNIIIHFNSHNLKNYKILLNIVI
jgi:hypothetical protein